MWSKIRNLIIWVNKDSDDYDEKYKKIKFVSADDLRLNKTIEVLTWQQLLELFF